MALLLPPLPLLSPPRHHFASPLLTTPRTKPLSPIHHHHHLLLPSAASSPLRRLRGSLLSASLGQEDSGSSDTAVAGEVEAEEPASSDAAAASGDASPEDLESVREIQRVLELLKKNRDMTFGEVKLTIMIEDPRDIERKRLLGIEDPDEVTRDDLADALVEVNEGRIPENRVALRLLAKEMMEWPDIEIEAPKKKSRPGKSAYAKATDTGVDPKTAAKRLNIDWDSAADIDDDEDEDEEVEMPPAVGYGALYLVTAFPVIIGISVVLILFYNSLQ